MTRTQKTKSEVDQGFKNFQTHVDQDFKNSFSKISNFGIDYYSILSIIRISKGNKTEVDHLSKIKGEKNNEENGRIQDGYTF